MFKKAVGRGRYLRDNFLIRSACIRCGLEHATGSLARFSVHFYASRASIQDEQ